MTRSSIQTLFTWRTSPYSSRRLKKTEIRLLHLAPGRFNDLISIRLQRSTLSDKLQYEALSYTWGTDISPFQAHVNGKNMWITANLDCALRHLRYETDCRTLWVDALCINQKSLKERNHQVQQMRAIYSIAREVLVWLGPGSYGDIYFAKLFKKKEPNLLFSDRFCKFHPELNVEKVVLLEGISRQGCIPLDADDWPQAFEYIKHGTIPDSAIDRTMLLHRLVDMCSRPYFRRVWVVQELALSKNDPIVYLGRDSLPWSEVVAFVDRVCNEISDSQAQLEVWRHAEQDAEDVERVSHLYQENEPQRDAQEMGESDEDSGGLYKSLQTSVDKTKQKKSAHRDSEQSFQDFGYREQALSTARELSCRNVRPVSSLFGVGSLKGAFCFLKLQEMRELARSTTSTSLGDYMFLTRHMYATDPRDKIYGLLGLANLPESPVTPNYSNTVQDTFSQVTADLIRTKFEVVYTQPLHGPRSNDTTTPMRIDGLPSWVPDWSLDPADDRLELEDMNNSRFHSPEWSYSGYHHSILHALQCANGFAPVARSSPDHRTLYTVGVHISTIEVAAAECLPKLRQSNTGHKASFVSAAALFDFYTTVAMPRGVAPESLFSLLLADLRPPLIIEDVLEAAIKQHSTDVHVYNGPFSRNHGWFRLRTLQEHHSMFITKDGHIGQVYHPDQINGIRPGDLLVGLFGINLPFILRPHPKGYQMINLAFLSPLGRLGHDFVENAAPGATWKDFEAYDMEEYIII